jgi:hypothetical protein
MSSVTLEWFVRVAYAGVGTIHLLPVAGILGRRALEKAYGVGLPSNDLVILMQHRAVLFGFESSAPRLSGVSRMQKLGPGLRRGRWVFGCVRK